MGCIGGNTECECLNGIVGVLDTSIKGGVGLVGKPMFGSVDILDTAIKGEIGLVNKPMCGSIGMLDTSIKGRVGIICTLNTEIYLRVMPEVLWLAPDTDEQCDIESNTSWIIL